MSTTQTSFSSFRDLGRAMDRAQRELDIKAAEKLKRSRSLSNKKPGTGPRIAKVSA